MEVFEECLAAEVEGVLAGELEDVLPVAVDMGGESTHQGRAIKAEMAKFTFTST